MPRGAVHGGQQPITGAAIQVFEVGTAGYGSTPTLLYSTTTDRRQFQLPIASWSTNCTNVNGGSNSTVQSISPPAAGIRVGANSAILLMAALGPCNNINTSTFVFVDEVTTVAAAYALGPFMSHSDPTQIGYPVEPNGRYSMPLRQRANLANTATGVANALTPNGKAACPQAEINTLADILAYCVNGTSRQPAPRWETMRSTPRVARWAPASPSRRIR